MSQYLKYCTRRFSEAFSQHIGYAPQMCQLTDAELREVIDACNTAVAPFGKTVSDERWVSYMDVVRWSQSARHVCDQEAFKAVCILKRDIRLG